jgi:hypothetical protein
MIRSTMGDLVGSRPSPGLRTESAATFFGPERVGPLPILVLRHTDVHHRRTRAIREDEVTCTDSGLGTGFVDPHLDHAVPADDETERGAKTDAKGHRQPSRALLVIEDDAGLVVAFVLRNVADLETHCASVVDDLQVAAPDRAAEIVIPFERHVRTSGVA